MNKEKLESIVSATHPYGRATDFTPIVRIYPKIQRNTLCPFTRKKFKNCCGQTGQNFCEKAKETLKDYLMKTMELKDEEKQEEPKEEKKD